MTDMLIAQLSDPFRIGLMFALVAVLLRTSLASGSIMPLAAGVVFIAVIIPFTLQQGQHPMWYAVAMGVVANAAILAVFMACWALYRRLRA